MNEIKMGILGNNITSDVIDYAFSHPIINKRIVNDLEIDDLIDWDPSVVFICSDTTLNNKSGFLDASTVEDAILKLIEHTKCLVVIKTSLTPDIVDRICNSFFDKEHLNRIIYNPTIINGENNNQNFVNSETHILGGTPDACKAGMELYEFFSMCNIKSFKCMSICEASLVDYSIHYFSALKMSFFDSLYDLVNKFECSYNTVSKSIGNDPRVGPYLTHVPGYNGNRGIPENIKKYLKSFDAFSKYEKCEQPLLMKLLENDVTR